MLVAVLVAVGAVALYFSVLASASAGNGTITANVNGSGAQSGLNTSSVVNGSTGNQIQFVYTAPAISTTSEFTIVVPSGWSAPQTGSSGTPGYVVLGTCANGSVGITGGSKIDVTFSVSLASNTSCTVTYGSGSNAVAPSTNVGTQTWTTQANVGSGLTSLGTSPQIDVLSANGSGTTGISPTSSGAASTGNTYTLTYTAAAGGLSNGILFFTAPDDFTTPQSTSSGSAGYVTSTCSSQGNVGTAGQNVSVSGINLGGGASCTITYSAVTAGTTYGSNSFPVTERSSASGSLTAIGSSPSVFVNPASFQVTDSLGGGHATAGSSFDVTVTAKDANGATLTSYTGTVDFSSSDSQASVQLPLSYSFSGGDNGAHTFSNGVTLVTAGAQTVSAFDDTYHSVSGTDSVTVDPLAATRLKVTGATTEPAGSLDQLTLTALDPYGNTDTSYDGNKAISISGGAGSGSGAQPYVNDGFGDSQSLGTSMFVAFSAGVATGGLGGTSPQELKIFLPAAVTNDITATDGTISSAGSDLLPVTVTPLAADHFFLSGPSSWTAGDTNAITITALDPYGNQATSYDTDGGCADLTWSGAGTSPGGYAPLAGGCASNGTSQVAFGEDAYSHFSSGVASVNVSLYDWQFANLAVTDGTISTSTPLHIGVDPAATDHFVIGGSTSQATGASQDLTITAADLYGNQEPGYSGEHDLTFSGADNAPDATQPTVTDDSGTAIDAFSSNPVAVSFDTGVASAGAGTGAGQLHMSLYDAETANVSVTDGTYSGSLGVTVNPSLDHFGITGPSTATAGVPFTAEITAYDAYNNIVQSYNNDGDGCTDLTMYGADAATSGDVPTAGGCGSNGTGPQPLGGPASYRFAGPPFGPGGVEDTSVTLYDAETAYLKITDGTHDTPDGYALAVNVGASSATRFSITSVPSTVGQNSPFSVATSALDGYGNIATTTQDENYTLSTTDGTGALGGATGTILSGHSSDTLSSVTYDTQEFVHLQAAGDLATSATSAGINVISPDGSGTMTANPSHVVPGSSGNEIDFAFTPDSNMSSGVVTVVVPNDWPAPSTNSNDPGYTKTGCSSCGHAGDISVSGQTITASNIQTNQTIFIRYGAPDGGGPGATAPSTPGAETWTAASESDSESGSPQPLSESPTVDVLSADGSGALDVSPGSVIAGSTGSAMTFTYTAATGGLDDGTITIAHPAGWTDFSAESTDTSACTGCAVSYPSGNLELDGVSLDGGQTLAIGYTTAAPTTAAAYTFATQEASSAGGTLSDLGSIQQVVVDPAALSQYVISGSSTQTAGTAQGITIQAEDPYGNLESFGPNLVGGDIALTFSGASDAPDGVSAPTMSDAFGETQPFGLTTEVHFQNGTAAPINSQLEMTLYAAENASIQVTDGTASSAGTSVDVSPGDLAGFLVGKSTGGAIGVQRSGISFTVKTTALDTYENVKTDYAGSVDFSTNNAFCDSGCDSDVSGFSSGVLTQAVALERSGTGNTISVADHSDGSKTGTSAAFLLIPNHFDLTLSDGASTTAGNVQDLTVTAKDSDGTTATSYTGTVHFSGGGAGATRPANYTFTGSGGGNDNGVHTFSGGATLTKSGSQTVTATDTGVAGLTGSVDQTVGAGDAFHVAFSSPTTSVNSGATKTLTAEIRDSYNNVVDSSASVTFSQTGGTGSVTGLGTVLAAHGVATRVVTGNIAGSVTVSASSASGPSSGGTSFTVKPGAPAQLVFTSSTAALASATSRQLKVTIEDAAGNLVTSGGSHSVTFAKTAGIGSVTGLGTVTSSSQSAFEHIVGAVAGSITIRATASGLTSATTSFTVVPGAAKKLVFSSSTANLTSGSPRTLIARIEDAAGNVVSSSSHSVLFKKMSGAGTVTGLPATVTSASGIASKSVTGAASGSITIRATSSGLVAATTTFTIVAGSAHHR